MPYTIYSKMSGNVLLSMRFSKQDVYALDDLEEKNTRQNFKWQDLFCIFFFQTQSIVIGKESFKKLFLYIFQIAFFRCILVPVCSSVIYLAGTNRSVLKYFKKAPQLPHNVVFNTLLQICLAGRTCCLTRNYQVANLLPTLKMSLWGNSNSRRRWGEKALIYSRKWYVIWILIVI